MVGLTTRPPTTDIPDVRTKTTPSRPPLHTHRELLRVEGRDVDVLVIGDGAPVVFLHGYGANPQVYNRSLRRLARHGRQVIAPALPTFGRSQPLRLRDQNVSGVAEHMHKAITFYDPHMGPVDLVGHSFGGGVALRMAVAHPEMVKSLTLICPVGGAGMGPIRVRDIVWGIAMGDGGKAWIVNTFRHFLPACLWHGPAMVATGLSAWFSDQISDVQALESLGISVRFVFAAQDRLVRAGAIPTFASTRVTVETQPGRHSWLIGECDRFVELIMGPTRQPDEPVVLA